MTTQPEILQERLRRQLERRELNRLLGDGGLRGRSGLVAPLMPARKAGGVRELPITMPEPLSSGGRVFGSAQGLVMSATAASIASGGAYVAFQTVLERHGGFADVAASSSWVHPIAGWYVLIYEHEWDTYENGGTIELELDGIVPPGGVLVDGTSGQDVQTMTMYFAAAGTIGRIKVTHNDASAQNCDALVRVGIPDPAPSDAWTLVFTADAWGLVHDGSSWWTTEGATDSPVSKRNSAGTVITSFTPSEGDFSGARGITFDGTDLWITGGGDVDTTEPIHQYELDGTFVSGFSTGPATRGNYGLTWDGTHLWVLEAQSGDVERWTTAGVLDTSWSLPGTGTDYRGLAFYDGQLYIVNSANNRVDIFSTAGALIGVIDVSDAVTGPTGVFITADGTLYISKDDDAVYRRTSKLT